MDKEKIVHLTSVHNPFDNRIFHKQCKSLAGAGFSVALIAPGEKNQVVEGVFIRALPKPKNRIIRMLLTSIGILKAAAAEKGQVYHLHDPELIWVGLLLRLKKKTVIYDVHEDYESSIALKEYIPRVLRPIAASILGGLEQKLSRFFTVILAEKYYIKRFPRGVLILNYPDKARFSWTDKPHLEASRPKLLYTGNISEDRGALIYPKILKSMKQVELFLVGRCSGKLAQEMYQLAGEEKHRLHIAGIDKHVPFDEIMNYYKRGGWTAGLAIFPATEHYLNKELTKFFEYMGAGIPVICSDFKAWRNLIEKTGCGIGVNPNDTEEINAAVNYLINNPEKAAEMGNKGREAVRESYNWENEENKLIKLYEQLIYGDS
ncbi:glycosyltransferase [Candidatus Contubernalis alkaliaceticus]|uniref:glycosyltransferase n=1 Tax=Candidatus Contubernalis alkaliaceticus TaxID=338645 RepID=UPI001F4BCDF8|nr:glycosyltransferase [Candidatus Contubernalis alkalaceticus]UNC93580.1 glycosyltransferase [Candidatus Contubernalis alkalaceticus]